jgi:hypothetical protein
LKQFITLLALALLLLPMIAAIRRLRRLPPPEENDGE